MLQTRSCGRHAGCWRPPARLKAVASLKTSETVAAPVESFPSSGELWVELLHSGGAAPISRGDEVELHYACLLARSACCMDSSRSKPCSRREPMRVEVGSGRVVEGMDRGLCQLGLGDLARIHVPARLGYGDELAGPIPPGSALVFEVEVVRVNGAACAGLPTPLLRQLLTLPAMPPPLRAITSPLVHAEAARTAAAAAAAACAAGPSSWSGWVRRLRGPLRPSEAAHFERFFAARLGSEAAVPSRGMRLLLS